jgi:tripartite-type tricarboxylate transporter receptor subunit TctC
MPGSVTTPSRRRIVQFAALCLALPSAFAQTADFPNRPIKLVVPFAAGQSIDVVLRGIIEPLSQEAKVPIVIENRPGAAGFIAAQAVAAAPADGYTLLIGSNTTHAANAAMFNKLPYDPIADFAPVTLINKGGMIFVVSATSSITSAQDLINKAKQAPGKLSYGASSSSSRMSAELMQQMGGAKVQYVPYKSSPQAITDLLGGNLDFAVVDVPAAQPLIQQGRLRGIAVSTLRRHPTLTQVPSMAEAGLTGFELAAWSAVFVPAGTPRPVIARLNAIFRGALGSQAARNFYQQVGLTPEPNSPDEMGAFMRSETDKWGQLIRAAGVQPE